MATQEREIEEVEVTQRDEASNPTETEQGKTIHGGARGQKMTEKGQSYAVGRKLKSMGVLFSQMTKQFQEMETIMVEERDTTRIQSKHSRWLRDYEEFLEVYGEYRNFLQKDDIDEFQEKASRLAIMKSAMEGWFLQTPQIYEGPIQTLKLGSSASVTGSRRPGSRASTIASISSARLQEEQRQAEISAKMASLKQRRELELAKLELELKEEELKLKTEMDIAGRKKMVLEKFETEEINAGTFVDKAADTAYPFYNENQINFNVVNRLDPTVNEFVPNVDRTEYLTYSHSPVNQNYMPSNINVQNVSPQNMYEQNTCMSRQPINHSLSVADQENTVVNVVRQLRKPVPEITKFSGDPLEYRQFIRQFRSKCVANSEDDDERLNYLVQFTQGDAHRIAKGYSYLEAKIGYPAALQEIEERFGNPEVVGNAFVKKALNWPNVKENVPKTLDDFAIFLGECEKAVRSIESVSILQYPDSMKRLVAKLPYRYHDKWRGVVLQIKQRGETVKFHHLVDFIKIEAKKACDPTYGREAMQHDQHTGNIRSQSSKQQRPWTKGVFATKQVFETKRTGLEDTSTTKQRNHQKAQTTKDCPYCQTDTHSLEFCELLSKKPYTERIAFLKTQGLCYGCLQSSHLRRNCRNKSTCSVCTYRHPTLLHNESMSRQEAYDDKSKDSSREKNASVCSSLSSGVCGVTGAGNGETTMAIVPVQVKMRDGLTSVKTYAFLDPGSSVTFCTESLMRKVGGHGRRMQITVETVGTPHTMQTFSVNGLQIGDLHLENVIDLPRVFTKDTMPVDKVHIPRQNDVSKWPHLSDVNLPYIDADIGLLIGNNVPDAYTPSDVRTGPRGSPHATRSLLGWIVWNVVRDSKLTNQDSAALTVNRAHVVAMDEAESLSQLDKLIRDSINLDFPERSADDKREFSQEDKRFIEQVNRSIHKDGEHYSISLPFRDENVTMPDNKIQALKRLEGLKSKLKKNPGFQKDYNGFMNTILDKGYAERVPNDELSGVRGKVWYIPHHGIYHPRKPGKLRVVFDCTANYLGISLNNTLLPGPDLTNTLIGVLLRFRQENIAVMSDIEAMFYQVRVPKEDTDFLRFYWWPDGDLEQTPCIYRMCVHLFGAVSSPSCSSFALRQTFVDDKIQDTELGQSIMRNFYVDDFLSSVPSEEDAVKLIEVVSDVCMKGGFRLTKWSSNSHTVLETVPKEDRSKDVKDLDLSSENLPSEKALGIVWRPESDSLGFQMDGKVAPCTRRGILSISSSLYDPLGVLAPFILVARSLLQEVCRNKIEWDEKLDENIEKRWSKWLDDLELLHNVQVARCYRPKDFGPIRSCQLHNFADACEKGYGMVTYLRFEDIYGHVHCSFVFGKARVSPLKKITIPRMELQAATTLVKLNNMLIKELDYHIDEQFFWTDSMSVLRYVANDSSRFHTFVANRVSVIREATNVDQWRYVGTAVNPADCASRGMNIEKLIQHKQWFNGPDFLWLPYKEWPTQPTTPNVEQVDDTEVKKPVCVAVHSSPTSIEKLLRHYSSWFRLRKAVALLQVAFTFLKERVAEKKQAQDTTINSDKDKQPKSHKLNKDKLCITTENLQRAEEALLRYEQNQHLPKEAKILMKADSNERILKSSPLTRLDPFIQDGLVRVGGRLTRAKLPVAVKHPVILPRRSYLSKLILQEAHRTVGHLGKNAMLAHVRQKFWILGASSEIKEIVSKCVICRRYQASAETQKMASLPIDRLLPGDPPFSRTGMDFFGPFEVKRGRTVYKRYGVIFTCLAVRAVHLEVAFSLDTDSCINAIRRFIARRGTVRLIRSDNGTNIVGAERELREEIEKWNTQKMNGFLLQKNITWEFNPPTGSHFGGVWERLIRLVRKVLYSIMRSQVIKLDDEGLATLFCEVESILNGRPLTSSPDTVNDLEVLTPNHLLLLRSGERLPPGKFTKSDVYPVKRWRQVQYLADLFWQRWVKEYLPMLQQRQKWTQPQRNISVGDIVLVVDTTPRNAWSMGKVLEIFKDKQGYVRMVKLKTQTSTLIRPIAKLCLILEAGE